MRVRVGKRGWHRAAAEGSPHRFPSRVPTDPHAPCVPARRLGGGGSCQKMRPWPRASAAAAAFIFKLLSGQRARRGRGPRPAASLILGRPAATRPPSGLALVWLPAYLRVRLGRAPHAVHSPWLRRHRKFGAGDRSQPRRRRRPEARTGVPRCIPPGPPSGQRLRGGRARSGRGRGRWLMKF